MTATNSGSNRHADGRRLRKAPTGIHGLDEITEGGLPHGRPTLVCGAAGCGKTMFAAEFLVRGAVEYDEPGVFMMFEESAAELAENVRSLGFDLEKLRKQRKIALDFVHIERSEIEETGEYDLEGLFIRLEHAIDQVGAKRVVLDTVEALFAGIPNQAVLRAELRRLFRWLKDRRMTAVITGERGENSLTRYGLEEYVADCVILLDHRITDQVSTRRLRVVKYRGSAHGTNEYPFVIGAHGFTVVPITSMRLDHKAHAQRVGSGINGLDDMLGGKGVFRGSSVLISGSPGTGKSSFAASFANAACARGERALLFAYEESESQLLRNMRSVGLHLAPWQTKGLLQVQASRPTLQGLEQHLVCMYEAVRRFRPRLVVVDPISNLAMEREDHSLKPTLMRLIDFLKQEGVTGVFTSLTSDTDSPRADSEVGVSSLMDTWLVLGNYQQNGERIRTVQVLKSRGMPHSNQTREFTLSGRGVDFVDVFLSGTRILTGTARVAQQAEELAAAKVRELAEHRSLLDLMSQRAAIDRQITALDGGFRRAPSEDTSTAGSRNGEAKQRRGPANAARSRTRAGA